MKLHTGAAVDRVPGRKYLDALHFFEYAPKPPRPRGATLTRMRHELPSGTIVSLRAPLPALVSELGPLRPSATQQELWHWTLHAADCLDACALVLPTPAELMPGPRSRELLSKWTESLPRDRPRHYVWAPRGAWEPEEASALATQLGLVCAFDPTQQSRPKGPIAYARLTAMGVQTGFSEATLEDVLAAMDTPLCEEAFVVIDAPRSVQLATRLQQLGSDESSL